MRTEGALGETALAYESASVGYRDGPVVRDAELVVAAGDVVGLVGPNGAGKSTLLRAVTGTARVLSGHIRVMGTDASELDARQRARRVGVVPQSLSARFGFTAREFVELGRHPWLGRLEVPSAADRAVVERVMALTDTERLAQEPANTLSGGDLQRLALAQALAQEPAVLLLDEPTSHLDLNHRLQVLDLVRDLADGGMAVVAVFHDLDLAARYGDRLAVVADGRLGPVGVPREVLTAELVERMFSVRAVIGTDPVTGSATVTPVVRDEALGAARGERVFLVSGSGTGAGLMRRLTLAGYEVTCGALNRGDTDQAVAEVLGLDRVDVPPFAETDAAGLTRVAEMARAADVRVVCATPFGPPNVGNLEAAVLAGAPLVLVGELTAEDDFTGGRASSLWRQALREGARRAGRADDVMDALQRPVRYGDDTTGGGAA